MRPDVLAEQLALTIRNLLEPLQKHVLSLQDGARTLDATLVDLQARLDRLADAVPGDAIARLCALEARALEPGPKGDPGPPGLRYCDKYLPGRAYEPGDVVYHGRSSWACKASTTSAPSTTSSAWGLLACRGGDAPRKSQP